MIISVCEIMLLRRYMQYICWSQQWLRLNFPNLFLSFAEDSELGKIYPLCILVFWGWSFCDPVDTQNWMLYWPPFPLLSVCVSDNQFPVHCEIQETFQCKASSSVLASLLLHKRGLSSFFCSDLLALQCYNGSAVSRSLSYPQSWSCKAWPLHQKLRKAFSSMQYHRQNTVTVYNIWK